MEQLSEDIVVNILLRLPLKDIFRLKAVSKTFYYAVSNSHFYQSYKVTQASFLFQFWYWRTNSFFTSRLTYANTQEPKLRIFLKELSFLPHPTPIRAVASHHGLVLCSGQCWSHVVCNPLTRQWVNLPPPPLMRKTIDPHIHDAFYGLICYPPMLDGCTPTEYIVVRILDHVGCNWRLPPFECLWKFLKIEMFSSSAWRWEESTVEISKTLTHVNNAGEESAVVCDGFLHWMNCNDLIMYHPRAKHCKILELPSKRQEEYCRLLEESAGHIRFISISSSLDGQIVRTWVLGKARDSSSWRLEHVVVLQMKGIPVQEKPFNCMLSLKCSDPLNPNVILLQTFRKVISCNLLTQAEEELLDGRDRISLDSAQFIPYHPWPIRIPSPQSRQSIKQQRN